MKKAFQDFLSKIGRYNAVVDEYSRAKEISPGHAQAYVNWGVEMAQGGRLEASLEKFQQAAEMAPLRYEPLLNWGVALGKLKRLDEAIEKFQQAVERDPKAAGAYTLWGAALVEKGCLEEAKEKYKKAIELSPDNAEPYANFGIALARTGAYREAIQQFKQSLALQTYQPQLFFLWGTVLAEMEEYEAAIQKFRLTLRFLPKHAEAYYFWSVALNQLGRYDDALIQSRKALQLELEKAEVYLNQGHILSNLNRFDVAISNYRHATTLDPNLSDAYFSWGVALCRQRHYAEGYTQFQKAESLQPDTAPLHHQWGQFLLEEKQYEPAITHLLRGAALEPGNTTLLLTLAMALLKTGDVNQALPLLREIEKRDPHNPQVHYLLGTHYLGLEAWPEAQRHLEQAIEEKPDFEDAAVNLALVLCETGDTLEAVRRMRPIIRRLPNSARVNFYYGTILYRHQDYREAIVKYKKARQLDPDYTEPLVGLAELYLKQGELTQTLDTLHILLSTNPDSISGLLLKGACLQRQAEATTEPQARITLNQEALNCFEQILAQEPLHLDSLANQALIRGHLESLDAMNQAFESMLQTEHQDNEALIFYYWANALTRMGETKAAQEKMQRALQINPDRVARIQAASL